MRVTQAKWPIETSRHRRRSDPTHAADAAASSACPRRAKTTVIKAFGRLQNLNQLEVVAIGRCRWVHRLFAAAVRSATRTQSDWGYLATALPILRAPLAPTATHLADWHHRRSKRRRDLEWRCGAWPTRCELPLVPPLLGKFRNERWRAGALTVVNPTIRLVIHRPADLDVFARPASRVSNSANPRLGNRGRRTGLRRRRPRGRRRASSTWCMEELGELSRARERHADQWHDDDARAAARRPRLRRAPAWRFGPACAGHRRPPPCRPRA